MQEDPARNPDRVFLDVDLWICRDFDEGLVANGNGTEIPHVRRSSKHQKRDRFFLGTPHDTLGFYVERDVVVIEGYTKPHCAKLEHSIYYIKNNELQYVRYTSRFRRIHNKKIFFASFGSVVFSAKQCDSPTYAFLAGALGSHREFVWRC